MARPSPRRSWYRSFYWRIGITFVAFVVVFLISQGIILRRTPRRGSGRGFPGAGAGGGSGGRCGGEAGSRSRPPISVLISNLGIRSSGRRAIRMDGVRRHARQKSFRIRRGPVPGIVRLTALSAFGRRRLTSADAVTPIATAPVVFEGRFVGLVLVLGAATAAAEQIRFLAKSASSCRCRARSS